MLEQRPKGMTFFVGNPVAAARGLKIMEVRSDRETQEADRTSSGLCDRVLRAYGMFKPPGKLCRSLALTEAGLGLPQGTVSAVIASANFQNSRVCGVR